MPQNGGHRLRVVVAATAPGAKAAKPPNSPLGSTSPLFLTMVEESYYSTGIGVLEVRVHAKKPMMRRRTLRCYLPAMTFFLPPGPSPSSVGESMWLPTAALTPGRVAGSWNRCCSGFWCLKDSGPCWLPSTPSAPTHRIAEGIGTRLRCSSGRLGRRGDRGFGIGTGMASRWLADCSGRSTRHLPLGRRDRPCHANGPCMTTQRQTTCGHPQRHPGTALGSHPAHRLPANDAQPEPAGDCQRLQGATGA